MVTTDTGEVGTPDATIDVGGDTGAVMATLEQLRLAVGDEAGGIAAEGSTDMAC